MIPSTDTGEDPASDIRDPASGIRHPASDIRDPPSDIRDPGSEISGLFSQDFLRQLEPLSLLARQIARGAQRAERKSEHRGVSPEFAEYRAYVPGDDTRHIDWNAFARWRHLVLKLFVEEHDIPVYLALDCSASMHWGEPDKFTYARQVVAGLCYIGLGNHDRVGIVPLGTPSVPGEVSDPGGGGGPEAGDEPNHPFPANRGKTRFWRVLELLAGYRINPGAHRLDDEVRRWLLVKPQRGMVIWVSDLWGADPDDAFKALERLRYSRHEVGVIQVVDPGEGEAGELGEFRLQPVEGGAPRTVIIDPRVRRDYRRRYLDYQRAVLSYCRQHQIPLIQAETAFPVTELLRRVLQAKGFVT